MHLKCTDHIADNSALLPLVHWPPVAILSGLNCSAWKHSASRKSFESVMGIRSIIGTYGACWTRGIEKFPKR